MSVIDKELVAGRFGKAALTYEGDASAQRMIASNMCRLLEMTVGAEAFGNVLEIGCGTGIFTKMMCGMFNPGRLILNDISPRMADAVGESGLKYDGFVLGDAETVALPQGLSMIVSCSAVQWFSDLEAFVGKCRSCLAPGGILALSSFGADNLKELRSCGMPGLDYSGSSGLCKMLPRNGFEVLVSEQEQIVRYFPSPMDVLRHLKRTGVTGIARGRWSKGDFGRFSDMYRELYGCAGQVPLTYHPLYVIAKKTI